MQVREDDIVVCFLIRCTDNSAHNSPSPGGRGLGGGGINIATYRYHWNLITPTLTLPHQGEGIKQNFDRIAIYDPYH